MVRCWLVLQIALVLLLPISGQAASCQRALDGQLQNMVNVAGHLHDAFFARGESGIQSSLADLGAQIECTYKLSKGMKVHERAHLLSTLSGIRDSATKAKVANSEIREAAASDLFRQLAHMLRIYNLSGNYPIFFCDQDRSFWLQTQNRPQNPVHPETLKGCGMRIPTTASNPHAE